MDSDLDIWIYSSNAEGLWLLTQQPNDTWKLSSVGKTSLLLKNKVINICEDNSHQIWIGLEYDGISIYNKQRQEYTHITQDATPYSLGSNKVWCFYCDTENTMWVGTMRNGISYYNPHFFSFPKITLPSVYDISCQVEDEAHNLWVGTDGDGIYKIDSEGHITTFKKELHNSFSNKITCMYIDSNKKLWIGTYLDGFGYYQNGEFHSQPFSNQFPRNPVNNSIWSITGDNKGNLYLGNLKCGLHVFNPRTGYFHTFTPQNSGISDVHVMNVYFDQKKSLYMATCNGTCVLNTENHHITTLRHNKKQTQYIQDTIQNNVYIDSRNLLWIGGRKGLTIFDMRHDSIYFLNKKHRLEGNFVRGITEDNNQNIWVVTTDGITRIETRVDNNGRGYAFHCFPYSKNDGLQTSDFVHNSIYKTQNGHILTGGNGGYYDINPNIKHNKNISKVVFTELKVLGKTVEVDSLYNRRKILTRNIELTDLLSNAVKYTGNPGQITVKVWMEDEEVFTSIADNGKGIPDSEKPKVFDAFYQLPDRNMSYGSGIGLHIVKELLILHHGSIHIEDNIPTGAKFIFSVPALPVSDEIENKSETQVENVEEISAQATEDEKNLTQTTLLIVEDNQDLRLFLSDSLKKEYQVLAAVDGLHALSILKKESVDMVITDVMMPNMDGLKLCRTIKNDIKISHIPVIMLSAKDDIEHITAGLTEGADDYIAKPFNLDILKLRINKILHWKQDCHRRFSISDIPVSDITSSSLDESFIQKVIKTVEEHIESPQFSVEELSSTIGISRSNLYNKLMSITGSSPSEFIRIIRLKKSLKLLEKTQMTVAEVAYRVGFNTPKIFTHYFKEEYKMTPTEYRKKKEDTQGHCEEPAS